MILMMMPMMIEILYGIYDGISQYFHAFRNRNSPKRRSNSPTLKDSPVIEPRPFAVAVVDDMYIFEDIFSYFFCFVILSSRFIRSLLLLAF